VSDEVRDSPREGEMHRFRLLPNYQPRLLKNIVFTQECISELTGSLVYFCRFGYVL